MRRRLLDHRGIPKSNRKIFAQKNTGLYLSRHAKLWHRQIWHVL